MIQPQAQSGTPAARVPTDPVRAGQVPSSEHALPRSCFIAVATLARGGAQVDWDACATELRGLAQLGFGPALGIEPAERAALSQANLTESIRRAGKLGLAHGFIAGAACTSGVGSIMEQIGIVAAEAQAIEEAGGVPVLLPLATLSRRRAKEEEYVEVYRTLLASVSGPVIIDWTGPRVRPELLDYFPGKSFERVMALEPAKVRGARLATHDVTREVRLRRELLARDQVLFTSDRAHLAHLLLGANPGFEPTRPPAAVRMTELAGHPLALGDFSHAILGALAGRENELRAALERLAAGDVPGYLGRMATLG
jgi:hypothetical protein